MTDLLKAKHFQGGYWPTREQLLLLHAALSEHERAIAAWRQWNVIFDIEHEQLDTGSYRLLPLVYKQLLRKNANEPYTKLLQGLYKRTWYENQLKFQASAGMLRALHNAGIKTLILKGQALAVQYYGDVGVRPMADIDLLVPKDNVFQAIAALYDLGWFTIEDGQFFREALNVRQSHTLRNAEGIEIDLHWCVLHSCQDEQINSSFWEASAPLKINDVETRALCPTDQILHVCAHGLMWNLVPPIRWVVDALTILNTTKSTINWNRLVTLSIQSNKSLQLYAALSYLRSEFRADIPTEALSQLEAAPTTWVQRWHYIAQTKGLFLWDIFGFLLNKEYCHGKHTLFTFLKYTQIRRGDANIAQTILQSIPKILSMPVKLTGIAFKWLYRYAITHIK